MLSDLELDTEFIFGITYVVKGIHGRTRNALRVWRLHTWCGKPLPRPRTLRELQGIADDWILKNVQGVGVKGLEALRTQIGYPWDAYGSVEAWAAEK